MLGKCLAKMAYSILRYSLESMNIPAFTALTLKLFGVIFVLIALLDFISLIFPLQMADPQWQLTTITGIVDRGIVPMLGMGLISLGYLVDTMAKTAGVAPKGGFDLRMPVYILAIALGLVFLLLIPIHLTNVNQIKTAELAQLETQIGQGQQQVEGALRQFDALSQNPEALEQQIKEGEQLLAAGQVNGNPINQEQLANIERQVNELKGLQEMSKDPATLKAKMEEIKTNLETQVAEQRQKVESQASNQALKQGLRVGLSSLMLSIGFAAFGALGLRNLLSAPPNPPSADPLA
ncbi:hypothetical protein IQ218_00790 [Synechocystis salina LEGE 06099]|nr:hypothetical protein [Synechocystis salina LEGE 06099]